MLSNKLSSYLLYAIGEITLVVIGILLALFINNWNEDRKQNEKLVSIMKTVREDLVTDTIMASQIIQFYDSINKYSEKVINYEYDKTSIENCTMCRSLTTLYQSFTIQDKGYTMLKNFSEYDFKKDDSLQVSINQFYKTLSSIIDQSNEFVKQETLKNLDHFKRKPWFIDWMKGRFTEEMKAYFGDSVEYKNMVGSNLILASKNHGAFIKAHKDGAKELINEIDKIYQLN